MECRGQLSIESSQLPEHFKSIGGMEQLPQQVESLCQSFRKKLPELDIDSIERQNQETEEDALRSYVALLEQTLLKNGIEIPVQGVMMQQMIDLDSQTAEKMAELRRENITLKRKLNKEQIQARKEREELLDQHAYDIRRLERQFTTEMKERDEDFSLLQETMREQLLDELKDQFAAEVKEQMEHQRVVLQEQYERSQKEDQERIELLEMENKRLKERMRLVERQKTNKSRLILSELEMQSQENFKTEQSVTLPVQKLHIQSFTSIGLSGVEEGIEERLKKTKEEVFSVDDQILEEDSISNIQCSALQSETKNLAGKLRLLKDTYPEGDLRLTGSRNFASSEVFGNKSLPYLPQEAKQEAKPLHTESCDTVGRRVVLYSFGSDAEERKPQARFKEMEKSVSRREYGGEFGEENLLQTMEGGIESARKMFQKQRL